MGKFVQFLKRSIGRDSFSLLVGPHVYDLYRAAYRFTGHPEDAEDLVQSLLLRLYPKREELSRVDDLRPWLVRALYNLFIDTVRRSGREPTFGAAGEEAIEQLQSPEAGPAESAYRAQLQAHIAEALEALSVEHRVVVSLHDMEGYNLLEVAQVLDLPIGTVKSRLHRARARLRETLRMEPFPAARRVNGQG
ncbi:MAG TPA: RNA polymerase sigma factor [Burkholderiales bacterium]|nr:RNA polymerase sigma factor [Burkholderiales bacterium]